MKLIRLITMMVLLAFAADGMACTTGIISGKYTADGRPLMWKQRDSEQMLENYYVFRSDKKYAYIGCVPFASKTGKSVVYGQNQCGLAIMNSTSYNLDDPSVKNATKNNIIRLGLEDCATVDEFEKMLNKLSPFEYGSNYGVMDAKGNCAYFECGAHGWKKYDVNDPAVAPKGYIVRANFGFSGDLKKGKGYSRYKKAVELFEKALKEKKANYRTMLSFSRCLQHGLTRMDLNDYIPQAENKETYVHFTDFIPRWSTASAVVMQGVKDGENPLLTTSWTMIASPLTCVTIPVWFNYDNEAPVSVMRNEANMCPLVNWAKILRGYLWTMDYGEGRNYIELNHLINEQQTGILQQILPIENEILNRGDALLEQFRAKNKIDSKALKAYDAWVDDYVNTEYMKIVQSHSLIN